MLLSAAWLSAVGAAVPKPNVLVILADDMGFADVGVHGCADIPTPNLDSIAREGVRCTQGYVSAPLCSPSRAGLLTGRYQERFGHEFNPGELKHWGLPLSETTMAQRMKAAGYATGIVGKWHLGHDVQHRPLDRGFDEYYGTPANTNSHFHPNLVDTRVSPEPKIVTGDGFYTTDAYRDRAVQFVREHQTHPFFLYLAFNAVHTPLEAPKNYLDRFSGIADERRRTYAAMLGAMDDAVGAVLAEMRAAKLEDNTLIFFLSDNGAPANNGGNNGPMRGVKGQTWEGGFHVPFFVEWKGRLPAGKVYDHPVISLDILPTALAAAGVDTQPDWKLDGVNLLPFLSGERSTAPHAALLWRIGQQMAVRMGDWKLVRAVGIAGVEKLAARGSSDLINAQLFNLAKDSSERNNLASLGSEEFQQLSNTWQSWDRELVPPLWPPKREKGEDDDGAPKKQKKKKSGAVK